MAEGKVADGWYQFDNDINSVIDGIAGNGVLSGLTGVEDSPAAMIVEIAAGTYVANNTKVTKGSATDVTIEAADASNPRKDIIIADSSGNITVVKGTAAAAVPSGQTGPNTSTPIPGNITANKIILAEVWVGAGVTTILDANITDRRIMVQRSRLLDADLDTGIEVEQSADEDIVRVKTAANECGKWSAAGILTLAKQSMISVYKSIEQTIPTSIFTHLHFNAEEDDVRGEFDNSVLTGTADATEANKLHDADGGFEAADVGATIWNTTDNTYTTVSAFVDSGELTLTADIMASGEGYKLFHSAWIATEDGVITVNASVKLKSIDDARRLYARIKKNSLSMAQASVHGSFTSVIQAPVGKTFKVVAGDSVTVWVYQDTGENEIVDDLIQQTYFSL